MRSISVIFILFINTLSFAGDLPKRSLGLYAGEIGSYTINLNGKEVLIDGHDIFITIKEDVLIYKAGKLVLSGNYSVLKQNKNEYVVKGMLSNGKSIQFEISFIYFKRQAELDLSPLNGRETVTLQKMVN
jgi:hypothetical protein